MGKKKESKERDLDCMTTISRLKILDLLGEELKVWRQQPSKLELFTFVLYLFALPFCFTFLLYLFAPPFLLHLFASPSQIYQLVKRKNPESGILIA